MSEPGQEMVRPGSGAMFDRIAERYDLLNRVLSFGVDRRWRRKTVDRLGVGDQPCRILDVATGTGDLAIDIAQRLPKAEVVGVDPSSAMLERGRTKVDRLGLAQRVQLLIGDGEALAMPDDSFDAASIAFGIRNVPDRARGLREMARVVRPGGRVCILELSEPRSGAIAPLARFHVHVVVPWLGSLLSGAREYRYLQRSIAAFPPADEFAAMMIDSGLEVIEVVPLTFGVCHLYVGQKPRGARA